MEEREIKTQAIVLSSEDSGEADRIITLLTVDKGKLRAKIKGVKRNKAKLSYASFPFNFGEYLLVRTGRSFTVTNCSYIDNFSKLTMDLNKYWAGCGVLEVANHLARETEDSFGIFMAVLKTIKMLAYNEELNIISVLSKFLVEALEMSGFKPTAEILDREHYYFDFMIGRLSSVETEEMIQLSTEDGENLELLFNTKFDDFDYTKKVSKTILKLLILFYENKVDEEIKLLKKFI